MKGGGSKILYYCDVIRCELEKFTGTKTVLQILLTRYIDMFIQFGSIRDTPDYLLTLSPEILSCCLQVNPCRPFDISYNSHFKNTKFVASTFRFQQADQP